jgi:alkyl sulfatase BDS1-like metallo-beta-lactamase superfamily hydrolase
MGAPAELVEAPNGAIVNKEVLDRLPTIAWTKGPEIENPVEGVYVLGGYIISACIVVEAADGLIVFDTGDTKKDGERLLEAIRSVSEKPVKAVVYGHSHYAFGAGVIAEGNEDVVVYGHPNLTAPERSVDYFRVRIDPEKSGTTDKVVRFEFTDGNKPVVGLHIRRAVAEYLPDRTSITGPPISS